VVIGGVEYFDGGVHSPTNAGVLLSLRPAVVLVISPMSASSFPSRRADALMRWSAHRRLVREAGRLIAAGCRVVRIEPGPTCLDAMGLRPMDENRASKVAESAYHETLRRIDEGLFADIPVSAKVPTGL
jgi:NTE family protein